MVRIVLQIKGSCDLGRLVYVAGLIAMFVPGVGVAEDAKLTKVLFLGDSLTEGYGVRPEQAFPERIKQLASTRLGKDIEILNAGVSGSTTASGLDRLRWYLKQEPDILVLALGANDGLRGVPPESSRKNLEQIVVAAKQAGLTIVLAGMMLPPNYGPKHTSEFREMFAAIARKHELILIPFLLEGVAGDHRYNLPDGIHPNANGYQIVAETVFAALEPLL